MATNEYVLFERYIGKESEEEPIMIRLSCEKDYEVMFAAPMFVKIYEGLSMGSPYIVVDFWDANGDGVNINKIDTDAIFNLYFGRGLAESRHAKMKIAKVAFDNGKAGTSSRFAFSVHFVHESWNSFIHKTHNRGWKNIKYSEIVTAIAQECKFNVLKISETKKSKLSVVQTDWNNLDLLKRISSKAEPISGSDGHFEFGVDLEGNFFFMPFSDLITNAHENRRDRPDSENRKGMPVLRLDGNSPSQYDRKKMNEENGKIPVSFSTYSVDENFMDKIIQGAGGVTSMYYDFETGTYVKKDNKLSEQTTSQLSEWTLVHPSNEISSLKIMGGRNPEIQQEAVNRLSNVSNSIQKVKIEADGTPFIRIGDVVEVIIPNPPETYSEPFNEIYSGYYVVASVNNIFRLHKNTAYKTVLTLTRQGIDKKDLEGYVRTTKGKNVT